VANIQEASVIYCDDAPDGEALQILVSRPGGSIQVSVVTISSDREDILSQATLSVPIPEKFRK